MTLKYTPLDEIAKIHTCLRATFDSGKTLPLSYRRQQLPQLARMVQQNAHAFEDALWREFRKQPLEIAMVDLSPVVSAALYAAENLERWAKREENGETLTATQKSAQEDRMDEEDKPWKTTIHKQPKGLVVNISPWNYPIILSLSPLVGAIAAGCTAILKPSEHTPLVSALFAELFPKYLDPDAYAVVNGAVDETGCLLGMKFDHIFFTGSTHVGRIVATAAAKQLTTVTLELGGKSPVFVDAAHTDLDIAARRILWGRQVCAGQVCVSPDYVLVPRAHQDAFVDAVRRVYEEFWPEWASSPRNGVATDDNGVATDGNGEATDCNGTVAGINTLRRPPKRKEQNQRLVRETKGEVVVGAATGSRKEDERIGAATNGPSEMQGQREKDGDDLQAGLGDDPILAPTIVRDVCLGDALMKGEIFGPILPIVPVDGDDDARVNEDDDAYADSRREDTSANASASAASKGNKGDCVDAAIRVITSHPAPLVIYVFTEREGVKDRFLRSTRSGTLVLNDCVQQLAVYEMPFGGVGDSGSGAWFGKATFDTFTNLRRVRART